MKGKKFALLVFMVAIATLFAMQATVYATEFEDVDPMSAKAITLDTDTEAKIITSDQTVTFKFTPSKEGRYVFESSFKDDETVDPEGRVQFFDVGSYGTSGQNDDYGESSNFRVSFYALEGETYYLQAIERNGANNVSFNVKLSYAEFQEISYKPIKPIVFYVNDYAHGFMDTDDDSKQFFHYYIDFNYGDKITVKKSDGTSKEYEYKFDEKSGDDCFVNGNEAIPYHEFEIISDQYEKHWNLGDNAFTIKYNGCDCEVPVKVIESPIKSISFTLADPGVMYLNDPANGYEETDGSGKKYYNYSRSLQDGDKLTVVSDSGTKTYEYMYLHGRHDWYFVNGDDLIYGEDVWVSDDQFENHWLPGKDNYMFVSYLGRRYDVKVPIVESPVKSISFIPAKPIWVVENDPLYGEPDVDDKGNNYFYYWLPGFQAGDQLVVNTAEGSKTYTYTNEYEGTRRYFYSGDEKIADSKLDWLTDQFHTHWTLGDNNFFTVYYCGQACKVQVSVLTKEQGEAREKAEDEEARKKSEEAAAANDTIKKADDLKPENYTDDSYKAVVNAKNALQELISKESSTSAEIAAAKKALEDAIAALKPAPKKNTMKVKAKKVKTFKASKLKKKAATFKAATVKNAKGKVSYKAKMNKKAKKVLKLNKKNGKITVKKGTKKGKYVITVTIKAAGNAEYLKASKKVKITVKVK